MADRNIKDFGSAGVTERWRGFIQSWIWKVEEVSYQVLHCKRRLYFSRKSTQSLPQLFKYMTLWKAGRVESEKVSWKRGEGEKREHLGCNYWQRIFHILLLPIKLATQKSSLDYFTMHRAKTFSLFVKSPYPSWMSAESAMTEFDYLCMKGVNINGHIAVRFLIFREQEAE